VKVANYNKELSSKPLSLVWSFAVNTVLVRKCMPEAGNTVQLMAVPGGIGDDRLHLTQWKVAEIGVNVKALVAVALVVDVIEGHATVRKTDSNLGRRSYPVTDMCAEARTSVERPRPE
jgi:hypothetical protein